MSFCEASRAVEHIDVIPREGKSIPAEQGLAVSAGTQPGTQVHPVVVEAMKEVGVDLSTACPVVPGLRREDWPLEDPKGKPMERVRQIRDEVRSRVEDLIGREHLA